LVATICVYPSGGAEAAAWAATTPPAPGRLSMTTGWLSRSASLWPTARAVRSATPPAAFGTITRIGRVG
jgi:hypothetical protein